MGGKTHSGTGHILDKEPFAGSQWGGIVTSTSSLTLAMAIQGRKPSFALGTKRCFSLLETHPHLPLLHFSLKPLNPEDELHHSRSRCWSLISEAFLSLSTRTSTLCRTLKPLSLLLTWLEMNICVIHWLKCL